MRRAFVAALFIAVALAPLAAQDDRDAEWRASFDQGLTLLRARKLDDAVKAFEKCVELFPDRAVGHYNAACAHALAGRKETAVACLSRSFEHGFLDLAHVARDHDLDPLRAEPAFTKLIDATRETLLRDAKWKVAAPENVEKPPLVVWLHDDGEDSTAVRDQWAPSLERALKAVVLFPEGRLKVRGGRRWDSAAETIVTHAIAAVTSEKRTEGKPIIVGHGDGASVAWRIARANPSAFRGAVLKRGSYSLDDDESAPLTGLRVWLTAPAAAEDALARTALEARARLVDEGAEVVLEREAPPPRAESEPGELESLRWALGGELHLGAPRRF
jgi:predicted esterase